MSELLLALVVRLLPARHRDWGHAMRAETAALPPGRARRMHALGCAGAVLVQPAALRGIGYPLAGAAVFGAVLRWSAGIAYGPLRWSVVAAVALLLAVAWWGRRPGVLGPVDEGRAARVVRAGGCLLVGGLTATFVAAAGTHGPPQEQASGGIPIVAALMISCLAGFLALTARGAVRGRALATGAATSCAAAGLWLAAQFAFPPLPAHAGGAVLAIGLGAAAAALLRPGDTLRAVLCVCLVAPLLMFAAVTAVSADGPAWLIPSLAPPALSPADALANSRIELQDPYVLLLFLAALPALAIVAETATARRATLSQW